MYKSFKSFLNEATVGKAAIRRSSDNIVKYIQKRIEKTFKPCDGNVYANSAGTFIGYLYISPEDNSAIRVNWEGSKFHSINVWNDYTVEESPAIEIFTSKLGPEDSSFAKLLPEIADAVKNGGFGSEEDFEDAGDEEISESRRMNEAFEYNGKVYKNKVEIVKTMYDEGLDRDEIKQNTGLPPGYISKIIANYVNGKNEVQKSGSGKVKVVQGVVETIQPTKTTKKADEKLDDTEYADPDIVFSDLNQYTELVARRLMPALMITGQGGIGKSYGVNSVLSKFGSKGKEFVIMKGHCTAPAMYKFLYNHYNQICVFDDCDSIFNTDDGMNVLKGALDSGNPRELSWLSKGGDIVDTFGIESHEECEAALAEYAASHNGKSGTPSYFQFKGGVIFISNLTKQTIYKKDRALLSRCTCIDIVLSAKDVIKRIETVLPSIKIYNIDGQDISDDAIKQEVFEYISSDEFLENPRMRGKEINFRLFNQCFIYRFAGFENWKQLCFRAGG